MIYYRILTPNGQAIASNINEFPRRVEFENNKTFDLHSKGKGIKGIYIENETFLIWFVVEDEDDLLKSSKLFKKALNLYQQIAKDVLEHQRAKFTAHGHTLVTIQGQIRQRLEGFADDSVFYGEKYENSVSNIEALVKSNPRSAADLICYTHKRIADMRAHLLGVEVIHMGEQFEVNLKNVSLRRGILNQCTPFLEELEQSGIKLRFFFGDECQVDVDKNMFSLVMYNFFSNAVKYAKPDSEIRLNYSSEDKSLDISMISLKMERDEIANLSKESVRGCHASEIPGNGIGLFALQEALKLMGKEKMYTTPDYLKVYPQDGRVYVENHFRFSL